jgi:hypothetical protein
MSIRVRVKIHSPSAELLKLAKNSRAANTEREFIKLILTPEYLPESTETTLIHRATSESIVILLELPGASSLDLLETGISKCQLSKVVGKLQLLEVDYYIPTQNIIGSFTNLTERAECSLSSISSASRRYYSKLIKWF